MDARVRRFGNSNRSEPDVSGYFDDDGHAKFRLAREVAFSACLGEAWDLLRGGIESVAHASKILREPCMLSVWLNKDGGKGDQEAFKDAFERNKKDNLFPAQHGLEKLYYYWSKYSEWGSHTTVRSVAQRFKSHETDTHVEWRLNYTGAEENHLSLVLLDILTAAFLMENALYSGFRDRLQFDTSLNDMRDEFQGCWVRERDDVVKRYKIAIPAIRP